MKIESNTTVRRLVREEEGMTMGLAVIMIVLIGVMGAGLLTFVQRDLNTVVEVNRGQKAIEVSDAGVQAAKRQLLLTSFPESYNGTNATDPTNKPESEWSSSSPSTACGDLPSGPGKCITTAEGATRVAVRYLPPPTNLADSGTGSRADPNFAPKKLDATGDFSDKRDYFRVESDGIFNGSRRKVQAVLVTEDIGLPKAYFATRNIKVQDAAMKINNVSLFAKGNISGIRNGMLVGKDLAYGDWSKDPVTGAPNPYNKKARLGSSGATPPNDPEAVGAAAEARSDAASPDPATGVTYDPTPYNNEQRNATADPNDRFRKLDFDGTTASAALSPGRTFCDRGNTTSPCNFPSAGTQPDNVITYPFNDGSKLDAKLLQSFAEQQVRPGAGPASGRDNYIEQSSGNLTIDDSSFYQISPALSSVFVVRFTSTSSKGSVKYQNNSGTCMKGIILVINGDLQTNNAGDKCFDGVISLQDPNDRKDLVYTNGGNFTLNGFVNIEGTLELKGSVSPIVGEDVLNQPGYHNVGVWSWRECYDDRCN